MLKLLLACDKFKHCLSSQAVNSALSEGLIRRGKALNIPLSIESYRVSDGGEGFLDMVRQGPGIYHQQSLKVHSPQGVLRTARWLYQPEHHTAFLESAEIIGNQCIDTQKLTPLEYSSVGLGEALHQLSQHTQIKHIYLGLGSTATLDGGMGLLAGLGAKYYTKAGDALAPCLQSLPHIASLSPPQVTLPPITLIADVNNPWLGPRGGIRVYGPQKGLNTQDIARLEHYMRQVWTPLLQRHSRHNKALETRKHSGSAGGTGLALASFYHTHWESGAQWCIRHLQLKQKVPHMHAIITGEGCFDSSSQEGKITGTLMRLGKAHEKKVWGVFGQVEPGLEHPYFVQKSPYQGASHTWKADPEETKMWLISAGRQLLDTFEQLF